MSTLRELLQLIYTQDLQLTQMAEQGKQLLAEKSKLEEELSKLKEARDGHE